MNSHIHRWTVMSVILLIALVILVIYAIGYSSDVVGAPYLQLAITCNQIDQIPPEECQALESFYVSTGGAPSQSGPGWFDTLNNQPIPTSEVWFLDSTPCDWHGITCGESDDLGEYHIVSIILDHKNLTGTLPADLRSLQELSVLILHNNRALTGGIPVEWETIERFQRLELWNNVAMSGEVSDFVWSIPYLTLSHTGLSGQLPDALPDTAVQFLVQDSCVTGDIPNLETAFTRPALAGVGLGLGIGSTKSAQDCPQAPELLSAAETVQAMEQLRESGAGAEVTHLKLFHSEIDTIPTQIYAFSNLTQFEIRASNLFGVLSADIWTLQQLTHLILSDNQLTELAAPAVPPPNLIHLDLHNNQISGSLPRWLADFPVLGDLRLYGNRFSGMIPDSWRALDQLRVLMLSGNELSGDVPGWLVTELPALTNLNLEDNRFTGSFPMSLCAAQLEHLRLRGNPMTGELPDCFSKLERLQVLTLGGTPQKMASLRGAIPASFRDLTSLRSLAIVHSHMTGDLGVLAALPNLRAVNLNSSNFSGEIPSFQNLANMSDLLLYDNHLEGSIPGSLRDIGRNLADGPSTVDIRQNVLNVADVNVELREFLNQRNPTWDETQTLPPNNIILGESYTAGFDLSWQPIAFNTGRGHYEVKVQPVNPTFGYDESCMPALPNITISKGDDEITLADLCPNTEYDFSVRSVTLPNLPGGGAPFHQKTSQESGVFRHKTAAIGLLSLYMLALDNNLDKHYEAALDGIQASTWKDPSKFAVVLVDRLGDRNTEMFLFFGSRRIRLEGLPILQDSVGAVLNSDLTELDMSDGRALGAFMLWAIDQFAVDSETAITATFIGHGIALAPKAQRLSMLFTEDGGAAAGCTDDNLCILPNRQDINPGYWTDSLHNSHDAEYRIISPQELRHALEIATQNGQNRISVFDVSHCFSGSLEELYELVYVDQTVPSLMVDTIILSPNYTYFGDEILSYTLGGDLWNRPAPEMAQQIVAGYELALSRADGYDLVDDVDHPRLIVAIQANQVLNIKETVDSLASKLLALARDDADHMVALFQAAHQNSWKYDTTLCTECPEGADSCADNERVQDWRLDERDGLSDLRSFAVELAELPNVPSDTAQAAINVVEAVDAAVIEGGVARRSGVLWYAGEGSPIWQFGNAEYGGISIYTDTPNKLENETESYVGWQSYWYGSERRNELEPPFRNDDPYAFFLDDDGNGWDELLHKYWREIGDGESIVAKACMLTLQPESLEQNQVLLPLAFKQ